MIYRYTADSWDRFVHDLRTKKIHWCAEGSEGTSSPEWSGSKNWQEALDYAINGHPVGRTKIEAALPKVTSEPEPLWDVAPVGAFACIPAHAAGVPEDMFIPTEDAPPVSSPIVRIAVNMSASGGVDPQDIVNRGVAIVSLIDRIQASGRRVELIAIKHGHCHGEKFIWKVTVKRPEEPIDMDRVGLVFATPIMMRRFFFRVMEFTVPHEVDGYGFSTHYPEECRDCDLSIPNINRNEYRTQESANAMVQALWDQASA
jgi:hypothetical protein